METTIKILLVDDSEMVRLGLHSLLSMYSNMEIIGEAACADDAIQLAIQQKPDIVLMDIRMPNKSGINACKEIKINSPSTSIIMLTSYDDDESIYNSIMAGASGYVLKEISSQELIGAIEKVAEGKSLLDPTLTATLFKKLRGSEEALKIRELTPQEKQILRFIAQGKTNKAIADLMMLSEKTVRNYTSHIFSKLEVSNRAEAAAFAVYNHLN